MKPRDPKLIEKNFYLRPRCAVELVHPHKNNVDNVVSDQFRMSGVSLSWDDKKTNFKCLRTARVQLVHLKFVFFSCYLCPRLLQGV